MYHISLSSPVIHCNFGPLCNVSVSYLNYNITLPLNPSFLGDSENCCTYDFVEIQDMNSNNQITSRERVCGDIDPGHTYVVRGTRARLVFHTDSSWDERGLWVKYAGKYQTQQIKMNISVRKNKV